MEQGIFIILAVSTAIGLLESFILKIWCNLNRLRFSWKALFLTISEAILGGFCVQIFETGIIQIITPEKFSNTLLNCLICWRDSVILLADILILQLVLHAFISNRSG
jgi:hypothetical protein